MKKIVLLSILVMIASLAFGQVISEGFEGTFPPTDWTLEAAAEADNWVQDPGTDHGPGTVYEGTFAAMYNNYDISNEDSGAMITPAFDISGLQVPKMSFQWWNDDYTTNNVASLEIFGSTDGTTFTSLDQFDTCASDGWLKYNLDLATDITKLKIVATSDYGSKNTFIDDFYVGEGSLGAELVLNNSEADFSIIEMGLTSTIDEFTITNVGMVDLTFTSVTDLSATAFSTTFDESVILANNESVTFAVSYTPTTIDAQTAELVIASNGGDATISLSGRAYPVGYGYTSFEDGLPEFWNLTGDMDLKSSSSSSYEGSHYVGMTSLSLVEGTLTSPLLALDGNDFLEFYAKVVSDGTCTINTSADAITWTELQVVTLTGNYELVTVDLSSLTTDSYIQIYATPRFYMDNLVFPSTSSALPGIVCRLYTTSNRKKFVRSRPLL